MIVRKKQYLGDGVYAECDGHSIELTKKGSDGVYNEIHLDTTTALALIRYLL